MSWVGIILTSTVVSAVVTAIGGWIMQNKQIHAEIVSKARHQWIQEVRTLLSEYITEVDNVNQDIKEIVEDEDDFIKLPFSNQLRPRIRNVNTLCNKIILYFGESKIVEGEEIEDTQNKEFNKIITDLKENINTLHSKCLENGKHFHNKGYNDSILDNEMLKLTKNIEEKVNKLIKESSKYIKTEWETTKNKK